MSETKHTPGMLRVEGPYRDADVLTENGDLFAAIYTDEYAEADAARVVLTWNCHDDLVEALTLLEREMVLSGNAGSQDYGWKPAIKKTREALAKALPPMGTESGGRSE